MKLLLFAVYAIALSAILARRGVWSSIMAATPIATAGRPARILVIGATGGTGRQIVSQALDRGYEVTAFVRTPSKLELTHPKLKIVQGDVLDYDAVANAVRGQDAVVSALGHKRFFYPNRIQSDGTDNVLRAMAAGDVRRFVCETSLGLGNSAGRMGLPGTFFMLPLILPFYFWDKARQEQVVAASNLDWVIVRPGMLTNGAKRQAYRHGLEVGSYLWPVRISRADVADFMLNQLNQDNYLRMAPGVSW
jgi:putative NADH-flavin reductase